MRSLQLIALATGVLLAACTSAQRASAPRPETADERPMFAPLARQVPVDRCGAAPVETAIPPPPLASSGTVFEGMVGERLVVLALGAQRRVVGSIFDPVTATWTAVAAAGAPRLTAQSYGGPRVIGRHLLVTSFTPDTLVFDPVRNRWLNPEKWPIPWPWSAVGLEDEWLFWPMDSFEKGFRLDLATGKWSPLAAAGAPSRREAASIVRCGEQVLVWGGWRNLMKEDPSSRTLVPLGDGAVYDARSNRWRPVSSEGAPAPRGRAFAGCLDEGRAVVYGGSASTSWQNSEGPVVADGAVYDFSAREWLPLAQPDGPTAGQLERDPPLFASAGRLSYFNHFNESVYEAFVLDPAAPRWTRLPKPPAPGLWARPIAEDGVLHIASFSLALLDLTSERWCRPSSGEADPQRPAVVPPGLAATVGSTSPLPPRWRAFGAGPGYALLWGPVTTENNCPACPPGASCLPCELTVIPRDDGVLFRW